MTEHPSEAEIQTLAEQIDERPWDVEGYEFEGGSDESFTVTLTLEWIGEEPTPIEDVNVSSTTQRDRIKTTKSIVAELEAEHDEGAPIEVVFERAGEEGLDHLDAKHEIEKLRKQGDVYEPTDGYLRVV